MDGSAEVNDSRPWSAFYCLLPVAYYQLTRDAVVNDPTHKTWGLQLGSKAVRRVRQVDGCPTDIKS